MARMTRQVCIVSIQHPELYAYLRQRFAGDEVILDRRRGERRQHQLAVPYERRVGDRRLRPEVDERLRTQSHVIVAIETSGEGNTA